MKIRLVTSSMRSMMTQNIPEIVLFGRLFNSSKCLQAIHWSFDGNISQTKNVLCWSISNVWRCGIVNAWEIDAPNVVLRMINKYCKSLQCPKICIPKSIYYLDGDSFYLSDVDIFEYRELQRHAHAHRIWIIRMLYSGVLSIGEDNYIGKITITKNDISQTFGTWLSERLWSTARGILVT